MLKEVFRSVGFEQKNRLKQKAGYLGATLLSVSSLVVGGCRPTQPTTLEARMIGETTYQPGARIVVIGWVGNESFIRRYNFLLSNNPKDPGMVIATLKKGDNFLDVPDEFRERAALLVGDSNVNGGVFATIVSKGFSSITVEGCNYNYDNCTRSNPVVIPR